MIIAFFNALIKRNKCFAVLRRAKQNNLATQNTHFDPNAFFRSCSTCVFVWLMIIIECWLTKPTDLFQRLNYILRAFNFFAIVDYRLVKDSFLCFVLGVWSEYLVLVCVTSEIYIFKPFFFQCQQHPLTVFKLLFLKDHFTASNQSHNLTRCFDKSENRSIFSVCYFKVQTSLKIVTVSSNWVCGIEI